MRVLIADDDPVSRRGLFGLMQSCGYEAVMAGDGLAALSILAAPDAPRLALIDWEMPGLPGPDVCRRVRDWHSADSPYLILLTSRSSRADVIAGLDAGADDYLVKPFDPGELRARVRAGARIMELQNGLAEKVTMLETALGKVRRLTGLLPICSYCKAIRDDSDYWHRVEAYVSEHADVQFSHGICPNCLEHAMKVARLAGQDFRG
jgi:sigma-B regulation protein RsbU (phosphoserine phosphatase)